MLDNAVIYLKDSKETGYMNIIAKVLSICTGKNCEDILDKLINKYSS
jgi:hypothetical protein